MVKFKSLRIMRREKDSVKCCKRKKVIAGNLTMMKKKVKHLICLMKILRNKLKVMRAKKINRLNRLNRIRKRKENRERKTKLINKLLKLNNKKEMRRILIGLDII